MFPIADQRAGTNGLNIFVDIFLFSLFIFFHGQRRALQLVIYKSVKDYKWYVRTTIWIKYGEKCFFSKTERVISSDPPCPIYNATLEQQCS